jgi:hypothetical protein
MFGWAVVECVNDTDIEGCAGSLRALLSQLEGRVPMRVEM